MKTLQEMNQMDRLNTLVKNLETTIETMRSLMRAGAVPSSDQLKSLWQSHEALGEAYNEAEKVRVKK